MDVAVPPLRPPDVPRRAVDVRRLVAAAEDRLPAHEERKTVVAVGQTPFRRGVPVRVTKSDWQRARKGLAL